MPGARGESARVVVATRNEHKVRELGELFDDLELRPLAAEVELPAEDGDSFAANALLKARAAHSGTGEAAIADDSGIEALALDGRPGIYSARYAGEDATDEQNLAKLLAEVPQNGKRGVAYVCALAYAEPGAETRVFTERCQGELAPEPRGEGGFGYDPAFVPADRDDGRTMAELSVEEKDAISHRGRAARAFLDWFGERQ